jgi:hypothetical protein
LWLLGNTHRFITSFVHFIWRSNQRGFFIWSRFESRSHHAFIPILEKVIMFVITWDIVDNILFLAKTKLLSTCQSN